jgi:hypothetical protein
MTKLKTLFGTAVLLMSGIAFSVSHNALIFTVGNPTCPTSPQESETITVLTQDGISEIDISIINTAVEVGLLTKEEGEWIKGQVAAGNMDVIDTVTDEGIISFSTITYEDE